MGGLWEAGVKSLKFHIKKLANLKYNFEELATLLARKKYASTPLSPSKPSGPVNLRSFFNWLTLTITR